jgi:hypothetical protein
MRQVFLPQRSMDAVFGGHEEAARLCGTALILSRTGRS